MVCSFGFILLIQGWKSFKGGFDPVAFVKAYGASLLPPPKTSTPNRN